MIAIYKSLNGDSSIGRKWFNLRSLKKTCGHTLKLDQQWDNLKLYNGFFTVRMVKI